MVFQRRFIEPIRRGEITCTVRIWQRLQVKLGGQYRVGAGAIRVDRISEIDFDALTPALARRSGFASLPELLKVAKHGRGERIFLIDFHYIDPAQVSASSSPEPQLSVAELMTKLQAMDRRSERSWTHETLQIIHENPGVRAGDLASELGRERDDFKKDVRKLKALGLTVSLEVGYELSKQGATLLRALGKAART